MGFIRTSGIPAGVAGDGFLAYVFLYSMSQGCDPLPSVRAANPWVRSPEGDRNPKI